MGSVELVEKGQKYGTVYMINPNRDSQVIFENTVKTIHQVWNNTNEKYVVTLYTKDGRQFDFTHKFTNIYTFENKYEMETISALRFDINKTENHVVLSTRDIERAVARRI